MATRVEAATMGGEIDEESDERGSMWDLDQKLDQSMDEEAGRLRTIYREKKFSALLLLQLSFQSLGVVYGDLGTSPLYVFYNTFPHGIKYPEDIIVFGGTFALYSLLCRHAKVKTIRNQHRTDEELTTYSRSTFHEHSFAAKTKRCLKKGTSRKTALLVGTCMVIGDGILTPVISVLSAAGGLRHVFLYIWKHVLGHLRYLSLFFKKSSAYLPTVLPRTSSTYKKVVFIFIMTDLDNVPRTIQSRCQKFLFDKLKDADIVVRLNKIASDENLDVESHALDLIAMNAEGSLRDAETMLEQLSLTMELTQ